MKAKIVDTAPVEPAEPATVENIPLVVDIRQRRPACVLIQAIYGCDNGTGLVSLLFDPKTWLVSPTEDMAIVRGSMEQWKKFADACNAASNPPVTKKPTTPRKPRKPRKPRRPKV